MHACFAIRDQNASTVINLTCSTCCKSLISSFCLDIQVKIALGEKHGMTCDDLMIAKYNIQHLIIHY